MTARENDDETLINPNDRAETTAMQSEEHPSTPEKEANHRISLLSPGVSPSNSLTSGEPKEESPWTPGRTGLKVLFLSSDTGGGHRASAESLAGQFLRLFPGSEYLLLDIMTDHAPAPYNGLKSWYKHLSAHPTQWNIVYKVSNTTAYNRMQDVHLKLVSERAVRKRIQSLNPDVVVSVHPLMNAVPVLSCRKIGTKTGKHIPIFTVVTDLGSAHSSWFDRGVEKLFIASDQIRKLAKTRGKVPEEKLVQTGLPIRHDFAVQSELLGDRFSPEGKTYQEKVREDLGLIHNRKTVLVMGGGEGVGSLSSIVDALYVEFVRKCIDVQILVVCGRNEKLKKELAVRDWNSILSKALVEKNRTTTCVGDVTYSDYGCSIPVSGCIEEGRVTRRIRRILSNTALTVDNPLAVVSTVAASMTSEDFTMSSMMESRNENDPEEKTPPDSEEQVHPPPPSPPQEDVFDESVTAGQVAVVGLGFVTRMAEYMVAADVLVSKAGPGTIAEAASLSLPVMLTSFLPGQEEGNVDFVVDGKFGAFCSDRNPPGIADEVASWLLDENRLEELSKAAKAQGKPHAAADIVKVIGNSTLRWRDVNSKRALADAAAGITRDEAPSPEPTPEKGEELDQEFTEEDFEEECEIIDEQLLIRGQEKIEVQEIMHGHASSQLK